MVKLLPYVVAMVLLGCAGTHVRPDDAALPATAESWPFELSDGRGREFVRGTVQVHDATIEVAVYAAQLLPNTTSERIESVRAVLVYGDTARSWDVRTRSNAVRATQLRALSNGTRDTVRFTIPRRKIVLAEHYLAFELKGEVRPPGFDWGEAVRHLFTTPDFFQQQDVQ